MYDEISKMNENMWPHIDSAMTFFCPIDRDIDDTADTVSTGP